MMMIDNDDDSKLQCIYKDDVLCLESKRKL